MFPVFWVDVWVEQVYGRGMELVAAVMAVGEAVGVLGEAVGVGLAASSGAVVSGAVVGVARDVNVLVAAQTVLAGEFDARCLYGLDGSRSAAVWLARDTGCSLASARVLVWRARRLRTMAVTAGAFSAGVLSVDKVDLLCRANSAEREVLFGRDEVLLVSQAKVLHFDDLRRVVAYWCDAADDAAADDRARKGFDGRYLQVRSTLGGDVDVQGRFDAVNGAVFATELARIEKLLFEQDWATARELFGDDVTLDRLARTPTQRRCDAAVIMATRSSAVTVGSQPAAPLFTVHVDFDTLKRVCELANETVVTPGQLAPWIAVADVERVVFGAESRVLDVGRRQRFFRGALRRAIEVRDRHCTAPGCRVPAHLCQVDHIIEWCDGGETTQENGRLRCANHNRQRPGQTTNPTAQAP